MSHEIHTALQKAGLLLGPLGAIAVLVFFRPEPDQPQIGYMATIVVLMAVWWITEAIPLAATSLLPFVLFPLLGIANPADVAGAYINPIIFLFLGGFLIALAMERWKLHRRIALAIIGTVGSNPTSIVLGFMLAAAFLSMWISNTATAVMMLPIGLAIIGKVEEAFGEKRSHGLTLCLMLGIAYGCSIGGVATLVGTPPNLVLAEVYSSTFPDEEAITFGQWMVLGVPFAILMLGAVWWLLTRFLCRIDAGLILDAATITRERAALGRMSPEEKTVAVVFASTAILWIFRADLTFGFATIPGWERLWTPLESLHDGTVAIAMALLLFLLPSRQVKGATILDSGVFSRVPWAIILLFGGGFALAAGFSSSGLSEWVAGAFTSGADVNPIVTITLVSLGINFMTELTSNTATTQMLLPLLAAMANGLGVHPLLLMIPATLSASMAFMMPVATPPNAIVFSSQRIRIVEMARIGLAVNFLGLFLTVLLSWLLLPLVFGI